jgi:PAS domain S-box-containing protein
MSRMRSTEDQRIDTEIHRSMGGSDPFAAAVRATRMPMLITDPRQPDNPIVFVNDAFWRLTGYTRAETLGRNCRFLQGPETRREDIARIRDAVERCVPIEIELLNYRKDGSTFWNRLLMSPVFDEGRLTYFFASQFDVTPERERLIRLANDREALEAEVQNRIHDLGIAEERLRFALQAGRLGAWTYDLVNRRFVPSSLCKTIFRRPVSDTFSFDQLEAAIVPEHRADWQRGFAAAMGSDGVLDADLLIDTPDGDRCWIELRAQTRFDADGRPLSLAGVALDITERKQAEIHRDLLTREMSHRVKNTLATVQSIVGQSLRDADVSPDVTTLLSERLQALAGAHDVLTNEGWQSAEVSEVIRTALAPFQSEPRRIACGGDRVRLSPRAATALALATHELATNAAKYGALAHPDGRVTVNWSVEDGELSLVWRERDGPPVVPPRRRGFGSRMIETALVASTNGESRMDYRPDGLVFSFRAPVDALVEASSQQDY